MLGNELRKEYGDYQTPSDFAKSVCNYIKINLNINPLVVIEPTCGIGNFIRASLATFENVQKVIGVEINSQYVEECRENNSKDKRLSVFCENFFDFDLRHVDAISNENTLIIGNPPWATNSRLTTNLPEKINFKGLSGTDAITGASNFDICEYIILKLINDFKGTNNLISMLCKTSVARNVILELARNEVGTEFVKILEFNASKVFGINASACVLMIRLAKEGNNYNRCEVVELEKPEIIKDIIICKKGSLSSDTSDVDDFEGACELEWRQGVKHDCASIMELSKNKENNYINKNEEILDIEDTLVFPLMKSSNFKKPLIKDDFKKYVVVTQKKARQETGVIEKLAPKTWNYLNKNKEAFEKRKSSIYKGAPSFSMFGVGDYSYAPYKVGVSGFYKNALFCLVYNENDISHPVMGDDTSYFLAFEEKDVAYACMLLLNNKRVQNFLVSISFQDAKRPYTKKVLARISFKKCLQAISLDELIETEKDLLLLKAISKETYEKLKKEIGQ